jgi:RNA polymerase sigma-70 factor (ECF subfamily)
MAAPQSEEESDLIALSREGDVAAFSRLMEEHQSRLVAQAQAFCGDPHQARDLAQETMVAAWKSLSRFDGSCRLFNWL